MPEENDKYRQLLLVQYKHQANQSTFIIEQ